MDKTEIAKAHNSMAELLAAVAEHAVIPERLPTPSNHFPLTDSDGDVMEEVWTSYDISVSWGKEAKTLLPGQAVKLWSRPATGEEFEPCATAQIAIWTARVCESRYILANGKTGREDHPLISKWDEETPPAAGDTACLAYPGKLRILRTAGQAPMLATTNYMPRHAQIPGFANRDSYKVPAAVFHRNMKDHVLVEAEKHVPAIRLAAKIKASAKKELAALEPMLASVTKLQAVDIMTGKSSGFITLDLPVILSDDIDNFVKESLQNVDLYDLMTEAIKEVMDEAEVTEVFLLYPNHESSNKEKIITRYGLDSSCGCFDPGDPCIALDGDPQEQLFNFLKLISGK